MKCGRLLVLSLLWTSICLTAAAQGRSLTPFTVSEEIELAHFDRWYSSAAPIIVSPNRQFVAIWAERGLLERGRVEDELRVYKMAALQDFVRHVRESIVPAPIVDLRKATYKEGPIISQIRWLRDSSGLAFLLRTRQGMYQLVNLDLKQSQPRALSLQGQDVTDFDVSDTTHYVYGVLNLGDDRRSQWTYGRVALDGTGHPLADILIPGKTNALLSRIRRGNRLRSTVWAADDNVPHPVSLGDRALVFYPAVGQSSSFALAPDGHTLAMAVPVAVVPKSWVNAYLPPYQGDPYDFMRAGPQNLDAPVVAHIITQYVLINLRSGVATPINSAPTGEGVGWWASNTPAWSGDGKALLLPNTYLMPSHGARFVARPCVAIFRPISGRIECVVPLKSIRTANGGPEPGFFSVTALKFAGEGSKEIVLQLLHYNSQGREWKETRRFLRSPNGEWRVASAGPASPLVQEFLNVYIKQGLNSAPVVAAEGSGNERSRLIWNPNPQLKNIAMGTASVYHWKDATGREWTGGLYKPEGFMPGRRYPLVIQTHGFAAGEFRPSGLFPTAFAARALAASGLVVLQVPMCPSIQNPKSGPCEVAGYDAAVRQLASENLIDANRVGIIGFSYTVYTALDALTTHPLRFAAASVTAGWSYGYWEYLANVDANEDMYSRVSDAMVGAKPFGAGLRLWFERAPNFNLGKVRAPLLVVALGRLSLLSEMWEPYAALRYLDKPVDLLVLHSDEHVLTDPAVRMTSQGGSVDWFRFWLQGYESPKPVIPGEYRRWETLCDMQIEQNPGRPTWCVPTKGFLAQHPGAVRPAAH